MKRVNNSIANLSNINKLKQAIAKKRLNETDPIVRSSLQRIRIYKIADFTAFTLKYLKAEQK